MAEIERGGDGKFARKPALANGIDTGSAPADAPGVGSADAGSSDRIIDPAAIDRQRDEQRNQPGDGKPKRGRGAPKGGWAKAKEKAGVDVNSGGKLDLDSLNFTLFYAHGVLAKITACPEFELDEDEAKKMATCCMNVMRHYNIKTSQKAIDWGNLLITGGLIYGARIYKISERHKTEAKAKRDARDNTPANSFGLAG